MVVFAEIIVNRLADVEALHDIAGLLRFLINDVGGLGAVVAADVEEIADVVLLQDLENFRAIFRRRFLADRAEGGGRRTGDEFEVGLGLLAEVAEVFFEDTFEAVERAEDPLYLFVFLGFEDGADEALVDDDGRATALASSPKGGMYAQTLKFEMML